MIDFINTIELPEAPCAYSYTNLGLGLYNIVSGTRKKIPSGYFGPDWLAKAVSAGSPERLGRGKRPPTPHRDETAKIC